MGFVAPWGVLMCKTYTELNDRQVRQIMREGELLELGRLRKTAIGGQFFEFYDPSLGGFYLRNADDPDKRKGVEFDWMGVDELTQFQRDEYDSLKYMLRSGRRIPFKVFMAATNPDGIGHGWVKRMWIEGDFSDDEKLVQQGLLYPEDFVFIPAKATDNPTFDSTIQATLMGFSDPMLVAARWGGSWDLASGSRFSQFNRHTHVFDWDQFKDAFNTVAPPEQILKEIDLCYIYGSLDYGTDINSASAFYLHAVDTYGRVWTIHEEYMQGMYLESQAEIIKKACGRLEIAGIYCDPSLMGKDSDGISRLFKFRDLGVYLTPGLNDRIEGWATLDGMLSHRSPSADGPGRAPVWRIHESCRHLIKFLSSAPRDELRPEDVSRKFRDDHAGDSVRYFGHSYFKKPPQMTDNPSSGSRIESRRSNYGRIDW